MQIEQLRVWLSAEVAELCILKAQFLVVACDESEDHPKLWVSSSVLEQQSD